MIIVAVGAYHVYKGASRNFLDDLKGNSSDLVRRLGIVGYIAKGLVIAGAGCWSSSRRVVRAEHGHRTRRGPQNTRGPTLRVALLIVAAWESSPTASTASPWRDTPKCKRLWRTQLAGRPDATLLTRHAGRTWAASQRPLTLEPARRRCRSGAVWSSGAQSERRRWGTDKQDRLTRSGLIASFRLPCRAWSSAVD